MDPKTGSLTEVHPIESRTGARARAWSPWFERSRLKAMDEDRAEEADDTAEEDRRWLWPHLGEIQWSGSLERERAVRVWQKGERERKRKEKHARMRLRYKQTALGKETK